MVFTTYLFSAQSFEELCLSDVSSNPTDSKGAYFPDINGDGWNDVYITNGLSGGQDNELYFNTSDGTFSKEYKNSIAQNKSRSVSVSFADVHNGGNQDCFVVTYRSEGQPRTNFFYENDGIG